MRHPVRHIGHRHELDGIDPVAMLVIPLAILMLTLMVISAIVAASVV